MFVQVKLDFGIEFLFWHSFEYLNINLNHTIFNKKDNDYVIPILRDYVIFTILIMTLTKY